MDVLLTVDVEAHRVIDEISGDQSDGLGDILSAFSSFQYRATFFVDLCEVPTWGENFIRLVCRRILEARQDLQLHVHPHHFTKDYKRWLLSDYTKSEQATILDYAITQYMKIVGRTPLAFRAGGFGLNKDTLELLYERGILIDCSFMQGWKGSSIPTNHPGAPCIISGVCEIPMTPVIMLGTEAKPLRTAAIDFNWLPLFVIKKILRQLDYQGAPIAVLLMHSSSMHIRVGAKKIAYRKSHLRKLIKLLSFLKSESCNVVSIDMCKKLHLDGAHFSETIIYVEKNFFVQYLTLLFQSFIGKGFKIKFALFFVSNIVLLAGLFILLIKTLF